MVSSFDMSSIRLAYSMADRTPPCLMLSLIHIVLVGPYCVFMVAVRFVFISRAILQFLSVRPLLCIVYIIAFSQALSHAFVTSRNAIYSLAFYVYTFQLMFVCIIVITRLCEFVLVLVLFPLFFCCLYLGVAYFYFSIIVYNF